MSDTEFESWMSQLAAGDVDAAECLWTEYIQRMSKVAMAQLKVTPSVRTDPRDAASSVVRSLCQMDDHQHFPEVTDSEGLWPLLTVIAARKLARLVQPEQTTHPGRSIHETDLSPLGLEPDEVIVLAPIANGETPAQFLSTLEDVWTHLMKRLDDSERVIAELKRDGVPIVEIADQIHELPRYVSRKIQKIRRNLREIGFDPQYISN